jgi:hypothetical protein
MTRTYIAAWPISSALSAAQNVTLPHACRNHGTRNPKTIAVLPICTIGVQFRSPPLCDLNKYTTKAATKTTATAVSIAISLTRLKVICNCRLVPSPLHSQERGLQQTRGSQEVRNRGTDGTFPLSGTLTIAKLFFEGQYRLCLVIGCMSRTPAFLRHQPAQRGLLQSVDEFRRA